MKYIITENRMSKVIHDYLDEMFPKDQVMLASPYSYDDDGNEYIDKCGITFYFEDDLDDDAIFRWYDKCYWSEKYPQGRINRENSPIVEIESPYDETLTGLFGDHYIEPFKQWFSDRYKLPVNKVI